jgi:putative ABC transport system permease protein
MFGYYFQLALRSFRRNMVLTALMVLAIALGIGASITTLTVYHVLSGDPIPHKSSQLFHPRIEPRSLGRNARPDPEPPEQMTRRDAEELLRQKRGTRQSLMSGGVVTILPDAQVVKPFRAGSRYTTADFFPMFDAPVVAGRSWTAAEDAAHAPVAVITRELSSKLFGAEDPVGRALRLQQATFQIIGVLDKWDLNPRFYDMTSRAFGDSEQIFIPFTTSRDLRLDTQGNTSCWGNANLDVEGSRSVNAPCTWLQYWVELNTPRQVEDYRRYLADYSEEQRSAGRFERPANVRLHHVMDWLDIKEVVPNDVRLQLWLAFGFLLVCLVNTMGLLLAKFLRRSGEIGVRRALGASRTDILRQCLVEAGTVGLAGALLGLVFALLGLWLVRQQPDDYAKLAQLDASMLLATFVLALVASLLAGLLPALRAMQIAPAIQLKSQ